jgi:hypothetical protein
MKHLSRDIIIIIKAMSKRRQEKETIRTNFTTRVSREINLQRENPEESNRESC